MSETVNIMTVTLALSGLPLECPHCGAPAPDGQWGIGVHGNLLHVICPRCFTAIAPVRAVADRDEQEAARWLAPQQHYHDSAETEPCNCPTPGTYAPQPVADDSSEDDEAAESVARAWNFGE